MPAEQARGVVFIHSCPRALVSHVEWAIQRVVSRTRPHEWTNQPVQSGTCRAELNWQGERGSAAAIASALRGFPNLRFEVTEDVAGGMGERFCFTPTLGIFRAATDASGDLLIGENRLRALLDGDDPVAGLRSALGQPWDDELEPFRIAADGQVRWLTRVG